jgi:hypothetical protein
MTPYTRQTKAADIHMPTAFNVEPFTYIPMPAKKKIKT